MLPPRATAVAAAAPPVVASTAPVATVPSAVAVAASAASTPRFSAKSRVERSPRTNAGTSRTELTATVTTTLSGRAPCATALPPVLAFPILSAAVPTVVATAASPASCARCFANVFVSMSPRRSAAASVAPPRAALVAPARAAPRVTARAFEVAIVPFFASASRPESSVVSSCSVVTFRARHARATACPLAGFFSLIGRDADRSLLRGSGFLLLHLRDCRVGTRCRGLVLRGSGVLARDEPVRVVGPPPRVVALLHALAALAAARVIGLDIEVLER